MVFGQQQFEIQTTTLLLLLNTVCCSKEVNALQLPSYYLLSHVFWCIVWWNLTLTQYFLVMLTVMINLWLLSLRGLTSTADALLVLQVSFWLMKIFILWFDNFIYLAKMTLSVALHPIKPEIVGSLWLLSLCASSQLSVVLHFWECARQSSVPRIRTCRVNVKLYLSHGDTLCEHTHKVREMVKSWMCIFDVPTCANGICHLFWMQFLFSVTQTHTHTPEAEVCASWLQSELL